MRGLSQEYVREVGSTAATSQDNVTIGVTAGPDDTGHSLAVDTHKVVRVRSRLHGVNGDTDTAVGSVLEANGEGGSGCEFSVELRLGRSCTDSTPGDAIGNELGTGHGISWVFD